jgi:hypothetical protein
VQTACPQVQSMSGIFSMASHWALQYLPEVVTHEQMGCAHFLAVSFVILDLLFQVGTELSKTVSYTESERSFCAKENTFQIFTKCQRKKSPVRNRSRNCWKASSTPVD